MTHDKISTYWRKYLATIPESKHAKAYTVEPFGDSPALADELSALVINGTKTATCSCLWEWQAENQPLTQVGDKMIVLNGNDEPVCIIETTEVTIRNYEDVDAQFASEEGEGDRSLDYWRAAHWQYFSRVLPAIGKEPAMDMPLVCERFRVVYP